MHRAAIVAAVVVSLVAGYLAGIAQQPTDASIKAQTRAEVRSAICAALNNAYVKPFVWQPDDAHKTAAEVVRQSTIAGRGYPDDISTPAGCRRLFE